MQFKYLKILIVLCLFSISFGTVHEIRKTSYGGPNKTIPKYAVTYTDALGRVLQSQVKISGENYLVTGDYRDIMGRDSLSVKPYITKTNGEYQDVSNFSMIHSANEYYDGSEDYRPNGEGYAYIEKIYKPDGDISRTGGYGNTWRIGGIGNKARLWKFTISKTYMDKTYFTNDGFIKEEHLDPIKLDNEITEFIRGKVEPENNENYKVKVHGIVDEKYETIESWNMWRYWNGKDILVFQDGVAKLYNVTTTSSPTNGLIWTENTDVTFKIGDIVHLENRVNLSIDLFDVYGQQVVESNNKYYTLYDDGWYLFDNSFDLMLKISMDNEGHFSQSISKVDGLYSKKWMSIGKNVDPSDDLISSVDKYKYGYSSIKNPPHVEPAINSRYAIKDVQGNLILGSNSEVISEDSRISENRYDKFVRLRYKRDSEMKYLNKYRLIEYDKFGRIMKASIYLGDISFDDPDNTSHEEEDKKVIVETFYDTISIATLEQLLPSASNSAIGKIHPLLINQYGNLAGKIAFNQDERNIVDLYAYDDKGKIMEELKFIPGIPYQRKSIVYNMLGLVEKIVYFTWDFNEEKWKKTIEKETTFDSEGRLASVSLGESKVEYAYYEDGGVKSKSFYDGTTLVDEISHKRSISEMIEAIESKSGVFNEKLYYNESPESGFLNHMPRFDGKITATSVTGKAGVDNSDYTINLSYDYVGMNALKGATQEQVTGA